MPYPPRHRDSFLAKAPGQVAGWLRRVTQTPFIAGPLGVTVKPLYLDRLEITISTFQQKLKHKQMKFKLLIPLLLICNLSFSQIEHKLLIGGSIGFRYTDDNSNIETSNFIQCQENLLQLNPAVGYFISKSIVVGLGFEYLHDKTKYDNYIFYSSLENGFSIAPFLRFYAPFGLFFHGEFDYGTSRLSFSGRTIPGSTGFIDTSESYNYRNIIGFSAGVGYSIKLNDNFSIEPSVRYFGGKFNEKDSKNDFTRKGLVMNIGLVCFIN